MRQIEVNKRTLSIAIVFVLTVAYMVSSLLIGETALLKPETYVVAILLTFLWWLVLGLNHWVRLMAGLDICLGIRGAMSLTDWWVFQGLGIFAILGVLLLTLLWIDKFDENKARAAANAVETNGG